MKREYSIGPSDIEELLNKCVCDVYEETEGSDLGLISDYPEVMNVIKKWVEKYYHE